MHSKRNRKVRPLIFPEHNSAIALVQLTRGKFAVIDIEDAAEVGKYNWCAHYSRCAHCFYAVSARLGNVNSTLYLHEFLLGRREGYTADHIAPGRTLDNRRLNLRWATHAEQCRNQRLRKDNTTGFRGVRAVRGKWRAVIQAGGAQTHLGYFSTKEEAAGAYRSASDRLHGEFGNY